MNVSHTDNDESLSQLSIFVLPLDKMNSCRILEYRSYKSHNVVRSIIDGEVCALRNWFHYLTQFQRIWKPWPTRDLLLFCIQTSKSCLMRWSREKDKQESSNDWHYGCKAYILHVSVICWQRFQICRWFCWKLSSQKPHDNLSHLGSLHCNFLIVYIFFAIILWHFRI